MIEAELKARVADPEGLKARLGRLAAGEPSTYHDTYYDHPGRDLTAGDRELRYGWSIPAASAGPC